MEEGELGHAKLVFHWPEHFTSLYPGQLSRKKKKKTGSAREERRRGLKRSVISFHDLVSMPLQSVQHLALWNSITTSSFLSLLLSDKHALSLPNSDVLMWKARHFHAAQYLKQIDSPNFQANKQVRREPPLDCQNAY